MRAVLLGRPIDQDDRNGQPIVGHSCPDGSKFAPAGQIRRTIIGSLDRLPETVPAHQIKDPAVKTLAAALRPFVHDRRKRRSETVRDMTAGGAGAVRQIADGILADRPVPMPVAWG